MKGCNDSMDFNTCLFFMISKLSRISNKIAEEAFSVLDICPTHGFLLLLLDDNINGLTVTEIADNLAIAPSTVTRFVDKLIQKKYVKREKHGKNSYTSITIEGKAFLPEVIKAWKQIYKSFEEMIPNPKYLSEFTSDVRKFVNLLNINFDM